MLNKNTLALLLLSGCCAVSQAGVQLQPEALQIVGPKFSEPPVPCPDPLAVPVPTLSADTVAVWKSKTPMLAFQSPDGLLKITHDKGPLRYNAIFADGNGVRENRVYTADEYLVFVEPLKSGQTELILVPHGATNESQAVRQLLVVDGEGPRPPPGPDPKPPEPKPPEPVKSFRVIFVKESGSTLNSEQTAIPGAKAIRDYLTTKTTQEGGLAGWREYDPQQSTANEQPTMKALWEAVKPKLLPAPCLVIEVNGDATVMPFPATVAEALETLKKAGG